MPKGRTFKYPEYEFYCFGNGGKIQILFKPRYFNNFKISLKGHSLSKKLLKDVSGYFISLKDLYLIEAVQSRVLLILVL